MQNSMHDILAIRIGNGCQRRCWTLSRSHARSVIVRDQHGSAQRAACQIARIQSDIAGGKSATDVVRDYLRTADLQEPTLRSFISLDSAGALQQAAALDEAMQTTDRAQLGPLTGVPIAIKDNLCTKGLQTTAGSNALRGHVPSYDATAVARLRKAGAVIVGKTNMDSFGMGSTTEQSDYQVTRNPWDSSRVPGGSSGGSAAAVAAHQCAAALGSDTGGSIRQPAHFCGVVGVKPTYGRVSRHGLIAYGSSLDCVGPMTTTVRDAALLLGVIAGPDSSDATSAKHRVPDFAANLTDAKDLTSRPLEGKRIGVISSGELGLDAATSAAISQAASHLQNLGAELHEVTLPALEAGLPAYYILAMSEASSNLSRYDGVRYGPRSDADSLRDMYRGTRHKNLSPEVKRRILMGTYALSAGFVDEYYKKAQQVRTVVKQEMVAAVSDCDVLLGAVAPTAAYQFGEKLTDPLSMYVGDLMTVGLNLSGLPAISMPFTVEQSNSAVGLPIGIQLIGKAFGEAELFELAHIVEQTVCFADKHQPPQYA